MDNIVHVRVLYYPWSYKLPPFELRATPQLYGMCYLTESSVKLETRGGWKLVISDARSCN